jgi:hypothetical protein
MSLDLVDTPNLSVNIPASFKRMAELQSIHRDATSGYLDILKLFFIARRSVQRVICPVALLL